MSSSGECPECAALVALAADVEQGEILSCSECGAELELRELSPPRLEVAPAEQEDWGE